MDTIGMYCSFENQAMKNSTINFLKDNFNNEYVPSNPYGLVDLANYKLYRLNNMNVYLYSDRIAVRGSIHKFLVGNNLVELTESQIKDAFDLLQFQLPIVKWNESIITRLDYGVTFKVSVNPSEFVNKIRASKNGKSLTFTSKVGTCVLGNKSHAFVLYDKGYESKLDANENLLRLEYRMYKSSFISKKFNYSRLKLKHLINKTSTLKKLWYNQYCKLEKDYSPVFTGISSKGELNHALISNYGYDNCKLLIGNSHKIGLLSASQMYNMNRYIRQLKVEGKNYATQNSVMSELDLLVDNYARLQNIIE